MVKVRRVEFQGIPVGNLYDVLTDKNEFIARVTYEDDRMKVIEGSLSRGEKSIVDDMINYGG